MSIYTVSVFDTDLSQVPLSQEGVREEGVDTFVRYIVNEFLREDNNYMQIRVLK